MPLPEDFAAESLYTPDYWFVHDVLDIDTTSGRVIAVTDTTKLAGAVEAQRPWPGQPKHVPGNVMIQATGTLGNLHAVYVLGLRMTEGWVGFGVGIERARFKSLATIGPPLHLTAVADRVRRIGGRVFVSYAFEFRQGSAVVYESTQTAVWGRDAQSS